MNVKIWMICELYSLDDALLDENLLQRHHGTLYLLFGVGGHEGEAHQRVLRSACGWNDGVDEDAGIEGERGDEECLVGIAHIERYDGAFGLANLKALFAEALQCIVGDLPQGLDAFGLLLDDVQGLHGGGGGSGRV